MSKQLVTSGPAELPGLAAGPPLGLTALRRPIVLYPLLAVLTLLLWQLMSSLTIRLFFPSPAEVLEAAVKLTLSGALPLHVGISYFRILSGWVIGCLLAIPLGIFAGRVPFVKLALEPYINFFRFVPPVAFITLALIWFGLGEQSKIALIVYTTSFTVFLSTMAGVLGVEQEKIRAAQCLGASRAQILRHVVVPAAMPAIITGMRVAMGYSFMTVIAAELVAAQEGIGFLIFNSRLFMQTENIFVGIISLGIMGLVADIVFRNVLKSIAYRYDVKL